MNRITLGILAHANAGKTTLTEQLLYHNKVIAGAGRVDDGSTVSDSMELERKRGISIRDSLVTFQLGDCQVQLIDTPGHVDFSAEVERAIHAMDLAVLVVSAADGIEAQTLYIWEALVQKKIPVIIFANKIDRAGTDYDEVCETIQAQLSKEAVPFNRFEGEEKAIVVRKEKAEKVFETLAMYSDCIFKHYLGEERITEKEIEKEIRRLIISRKIFPVFFGSALNNRGVEELNHFLLDFLQEFSFRGDCDMPLAGYVYSVKNENKSRYVYAKILQGRVKLRDKVELPDSEEKGLVKQLFSVEGTKLLPVSCALAGDIVILKDFPARCGHFFGEGGQRKENLIRLAAPALSVKVSPEKASDLPGLHEGLAVLCDEDPQLNLRYDRESSFFYIDLLGEMQAEIIVSVLSERFRVAAVIEDMDIVYKEAPTQYAEAGATYTCVSGLSLSVTPLERDAGYRFVSKLSGDFLHMKYQRQVKKLIDLYSRQGMLGWELTDMEVALIGGQFDSMGSDPLHFNIIAPIALFRCLKNAGMQLLEPRCEFLVSCPQNKVSVVTKSLIARKCTFYIERAGGNSVIRGKATVENIFNYTSELLEITKGLGSFSYEVVGNSISANQKKIRKYLGPDPRNEVTFIINSMHAGIEPLDNPLMKKKKPSRSKFKNKQRK